MAFLPGENHRQKKFALQATALATAFFFSITNSGIAGPAPPSGSEGEFPAVASINLSVKIPQPLGDIRAQKLIPGQDRFIFYIEDAHAILDAQDHIQDLIGYLHREYGVRLVALEGGEGSLDATLFRAFPNEAAKKRVFGNYLKNSELTGAEIAAVFHSDQLDYFGIEDWNLYEENYLAYLRAQEAKEQILKELARRKSNLDEKRKHVYSPQLNEFHEKLQAFRNVDLHLIEFLGYLLTLPSAKDRIAHYPQLKSLTSSLEYYEALNAEDLDVQVRELANEFKSTLATRGDRMTFNERHQAFLTGRLDVGSFLTFLVQATESTGSRLKLSPLMEEIVKHTRTISHLKGTKLFDELEALLEDVRVSLISKPEELAIASEYDKLYFLGQLANLDLTRKQWDLIQNEIVLRRFPTAKPNDPRIPSLRGGDPSMAEAISSSEIASSPHGLLPRNDGSPVTLLAPHIRFYELAYAREQALERNLFKLLDREKASAAIVIAGGFHTEGFRKAFEREGISYVIISPKIDSLEGEKAYEHLMHGNFSYKPYFETTFYDAFAKAASVQLAGELNGLTFRRDLKVWRDEVIRKLAGEKHLADASEYTRYIDRLMSIDYEKNGDRTLEEILNDIRNEIARYRDPSLAATWDRFEFQLKTFADGLRDLLGRKEVNVASVTSLVDRIAHLKPSAMLHPAVPAFIRGARFTRAELSRFYEAGVLPASESRSEARTGQAEQPPLGPRALRSDLRSLFYRAELREFFDSGALRVSSSRSEARDVGEVTEHDAQREALKKMFIQAGGNVSQLARNLGKPARTLHGQLDRLGILNDPEMEAAIRDSLIEAYVQAGGNVSRLARKQKQSVSTVYGQLQKAGVLADPKVQNELKESHALKAALIEAGGNIRQLARNLRESPTTVYKRLRRFGLLKDPDVEMQLKQRTALEQALVEAGGNTAQVGRNLGEHRDKVYSRVRRLGLLADPKLKAQLKKRKALKEAFIQAGGNVSQLARNLGKPRSTIHSQLKRYGLLRDPDARSYLPPKLSQRFQRRKFLDTGAPSKSNTTRAEARHERDHELPHPMTVTGHSRPRHKIGRTRRDWISRGLRRGFEASDSPLVVTQLRSKGAKHDLDRGNSRFHSLNPWHHLFKHTDAAVDAVQHEPRRRFPPEEGADAPLAEKPALRGGGGADRESQNESWGISVDQWPILRYTVMPSLRESSPSTDEAIRAPVIARPEGPKQSQSREIASANVWDAGLAMTGGGITSTSHPRPPTEGSAIFAVGNDGPQTSQDILRRAELRLQEFDFTQGEIDKLELRSTWGTYRNLRLLSSDLYSAVRMKRVSRLGFTQDGNLTLLGVPPVDAGELHWFELDPDKAIQQAREFIDFLKREYEEQALRSHEEISFRLEQAQVKSKKWGVPIWAEMAVVTIIWGDLGAKPPHQPSIIQPGAVLDAGRRFSEERRQARGVPHRTPVIGTEKGEEEAVPPISESEPGSDRPERAKARKEPRSGAAGFDQALRGGRRSPFFRAATGPTGREARAEARARKPERVRRRIERLVNEATKLQAGSTLSIEALKEADEELDSALLLLNRLLKQSGLSAEKRKWANRWVYTALRNRAYNRLTQAHWYRRRNQFGKAQDYYLRAHDGWEELLRLHPSNPSSLKHKASAIVHLLTNFIGLAAELSKKGELAEAQDQITYAQNALDVEGAFLVKISPRAIGWIQSEIDRLRAWLVEARRQEMTAIPADDHLARLRADIRYELFQIQWLMERKPWEFYSAGPLEGDGAESVKGIFHTFQQLAAHVFKQVSGEKAVDEKRLLKVRRAVQEVTLLLAAIFRLQTRQVAFPHPQPESREDGRKYLFTFVWDGRQFSAFVVVRLVSGAAGQAQVRLIVLTPDEWQSEKARGAFASLHVDYHPEDRPASVFVDPPLGLRSAATLTHLYHFPIIQLQEQTAFETFAAQMEQKMKELNAALLERSEVRARKQEEGGWPKAGGRKDSQQFNQSPPLISRVGLGPRSSSFRLSSRRAEVRNRDSAARQLVRNRLREVLFHQAADLKQPLLNEVKEAVLSLIPGPLLVENGIDEESILWFRQKEDDEGLSESNPVIRLWSGEGSLEMAFGLKRRPAEYAHLSFTESAEDEILLNNFSMMGFRAAENNRDLRDHGSPVFIWWLEKNFLPFAEQLGFKSLVFDAGDLSSTRLSGTVAKLEVKELRAGKPSDRGWAVALEKPRTRRAEARAADEEKIKRQKWAAFASDEQRRAHHQAENERKIETYLVTHPLQFVQVDKIGQKARFQFSGEANLRRLIAEMQAERKRTGWPLRDDQGNSFKFVTVEDAGGETIYVAAVPLSPVNAFSDYELIDQIARKMDRSGRKELTPEEVSFVQALGKEEYRERTRALLHFILFDDEFRPIGQYKPATLQFLSELREYTRTGQSSPSLISRKQPEKRVIQKDVEEEPLSTKRSRQEIGMSLDVLRVQILHDLRRTPGLRDIWVEPGYYYRSFVSSGYQSDTKRAFEMLFQAGLLIRRKLPVGAKQGQVWHYRLRENDAQEASSPEDRSEARPEKFHQPMADEIPGRKAISSEHRSDPLAGDFARAEVRGDDVKTNPREVRSYAPAPTQQQIIKRFGFKVDSAGRVYPWKFQPYKPKSRIIWARHGATSVNRDLSRGPRFHGRSDIPKTQLYDVGKKEAKKAAAQLVKKLYNDLAHVAVVSSPLGRALETAQAFVDHRVFARLPRKPTIEKDKRFIEISFGSTYKKGAKKGAPHPKSWDLKTRDQISEQLGEEELERAEDFRQGNLLVASPYGGESFIELFERTYDAIRELDERLQEEGKIGVVFSHGVVGAAAQIMVGDPRVIHPDGYYFWRPYMFETGHPTELGDLASFGELVKQLKDPFAKLSYKLWSQLEKFPESWTVFAESELERFVRNKDGRRYNQKRKRLSRIRSHHILSRLWDGDSLLSDTDWQFMERKTNGVDFDALRFIRQGLEFRIQDVGHAKDAPKQIRNFEEKLNRLKDVIARRAEARRLEVKNFGDQNGSSVKRQGRASFMGRDDGESEVSHQLRKGRLRSQEWLESRWDATLAQPSLSRPFRNQPAISATTQIIQPAANNSKEKPLSRSVAFHDESKAVTLNDFGVHFLGELSDRLREKGLSSAQKILAELKTRDRLDRSIAQEILPRPIQVGSYQIQVGGRVPYFGDFAPWEKRIAAISYLLFGQVYSEEIFLEKLRQAVDRELRILQQASYLFPYLAELAVDGSPFTAHELVEALRQSPGLDLDLEQDRDWIERAIDIAVGVFPEVVVSPILSDGITVSIKHLPEEERDRIFNQILDLHSRVMEAPFDRVALRDTLTRDGDNGFSHVYLDEKGDVVGFILVLPHGEDTVRISELAVDPRYRRGGIGKMIFRAAVEQVARRGIPHLDLRVRQDNIVAQQMYLNMGFVNAGELTYEEAPNISGFLYKALTHKVLGHLRSRAEVRSKVGSKQHEVSGAKRGFLSSAEADIFERDLSEGGRVAKAFLGIEDFNASNLAAGVKVNSNALRHVFGRDGAFFKPYVQRVNFGIVTDPHAASGLESLLEIIDVNRDDYNGVFQKFPNFRFLVPNRFLSSLVAQVLTCAQAHVGTLKRALQKVGKFLGVFFLDKYGPYLLRLIPPAVPDLVEREIFPTVPFSKFSLLPGGVSDGAGHLLFGRTAASELYLGMIAELDGLLHGAKLADSSFGVNEQDSLRTRGRKAVRSTKSRGQSRAEARSSPPLRGFEETEERAQVDVRSEHIAPPLERLSTAELPEFLRGVLESKFQGPRELRWYEAQVLIAVVLGSLSLTESALKFGRTYGSTKQIYYSAINSFARLIGSYRRVSRARVKEALRELTKTIRSRRAFAPYQDWFRSYEQWFENPGNPPPPLNFHFANRKQRLGFEILFHELKIPFPKIRRGRLVARFDPDYGFLLEIYGRKYVHQRHLVADILENRFLPPPPGSRDFKIFVQTHRRNGVATSLARLVAGYGPEDLLVALSPRPVYKQYKNEGDKRPYKQVQLFGVSSVFPTVEFAVPFTYSYPTIVPDMAAEELLAGKTVRTITFYEPDRATPLLPDRESPVMTVTMDWSRGNRGHFETDRIGKYWNWKDRVIRKKAYGDLKRYLRGERLRPPQLGPIKVEHDKRTKIKYVNMGGRIPIPNSYDLPEITAHPFVSESGKKRVGFWAPDDQVKSPDDAVTIVKLLKNRWRTVRIRRAEARVRERSRKVYWEDQELFDLFVAFLSKTRHSAAEKDQLTRAVRKKEGRAIELKDAISPGRRRDLAPRRRFTHQFELVDRANGRVLYRITKDPFFKMAKHFDEKGYLDAFITPQQADKDFSEAIVSIKNVHERAIYQVLRDHLDRLMKSGGELEALSAMVWADMLRIMFVRGVGPDHQFLELLHSIAQAKRFDDTRGKEGLPPKAAYAIRFGKAHPLEWVRPAVRPLMPKLREVLLFMDQTFPERDQLFHQRNRSEARAVATPEKETAVSKTRHGGNNLWTKLTPRLILPRPSAVVKEFESELKRAEGPGVEPASLKRESKVSTWSTYQSSKTLRLDADHLTQAELTLYDLKSQGIINYSPYHPPRSEARLRNDPSSLRRVTVARDSAERRILRSEARGIEQLIPDLSHEDREKVLSAGRMIRSFVQSYSSNSHYLGRVDHSQVASLSRALHDSMESLHDLAVSLSLLVMSGRPHVWITKSLNSTFHEVSEAVIRSVNKNFEKALMDPNPAVRNMVADTLVDIDRGLVGMDKVLDSMVSDPATVGPVHQAIRREPMKISASAKQSYQQYLRKSKEAARRLVFQAFSTAFDELLDEELQLKQDGSLDGLLLSLRELRQQGFDIIHPREPRTTLQEGDYGTLEQLVTFRDALLDIMDSYFVEAGKIKSAAEKEYHRQIKKMLITQPPAKSDSIDVAFEVHIHVIESFIRHIESRRAEARSEADAEAAQDRWRAVNWHPVISSTLMFLSHPSLPQVRFNTATNTFETKWVEGIDMEALAFQNLTLADDAFAKQIVEWAIQISKAVILLHETGRIQHGDLAPDNVVIEPSNNPVLIDFGDEAWDDTAAISRLISSPLFIKVVFPKYAGKRLVKEEIDRDLSERFDQELLDIGNRKNYSSVGEFVRVLELYVARKWPMQGSNQVPRSEARASEDDSMKEAEEEDVSRRDFLRVTGATGLSLPVLGPLSGPLQGKIAMGLVSVGTGLLEDGPQLIHWLAETMFGGASTAVRAVPMILKGQDRSIEHEDLSAYFEATLKWGDVLSKLFVGKWRRIAGQDELERLERAHLGILTRSKNLIKTKHPEYMRYRLKPDWQTAFFQELSEEEQERFMEKSFISDQMAHRLVPLLHQTINPVVHEFNVFGRLRRRMREQELERVVKFIMERGALPDDVEQRMEFERRAEETLLRTSREKTLHPNFPKHYQWPWIRHHTPHFLTDPDVFRQHRLRSEIRGIDSNSSRSEVRGWDFGKRMIYDAVQEKLVLDGQPAKLIGKGILHRVFHYPVGGRNVAFRIFREHGSGHAVVRQASVNFKRLGAKGISPKLLAEGFTGGDPQKGYPFHAVEAIDGRSLDGIGKLDGRQLSMVFALLDRLLEKVVIWIAAFLLALKEIETISDILRELERGEVSLESVKLDLLIDFKTTAMLFAKLALDLQDARSLEQYRNILEELEKRRLEVENHIATHVNAGQHSGRAGRSEAILAAQNHLRNAVHEIDELKSEIQTVLEGRGPKGALPKTVERELATDVSSRAEVRARVTDAELIDAYDELSKTLGRNPTSMELGRQLNIHKTTVWKRLKRLALQGINLNLAPRGRPHSFSVDMMKKTYQRLQEELQRDPRNEELAKALKSSENTIMKYRGLLALQGTFLDVSSEIRRPSARSIRAQKRRDMLLKILNDASQRLTVGQLVKEARGIEGYEKLAKDSVKYDISRDYSLWSHQRLVTTMAFKGRVSRDQSESGERSEIRDSMVRETSNIEEPTFETLDRDSRAIPRARGSDLFSQVLRGEVRRVVNTIEENGAHGIEMVVFRLAAIAETTLRARSEQEAITREVSELTPEARELLLHPEALDLGSLDSLIVDASLFNEDSFRRAAETVFTELLESGARVAATFEAATPDAQLASDLSRKLPAGFSLISYRDYQLPESRLNRFGFRESLVILPPQVSFTFQSESPLHKRVLFVQPSLIHNLELDFKEFMALAQLAAARGVTLEEAVTWLNRLAESQATRKEFSLAA